MRRFSAVDADAEAAPTASVRLGGVFSQVRRYRGVGDLPSGGDVDDARVDLAAPGDVPAARAGRVRDGGEPGQAGGVADGVGELFAGDEPGERRGDAAGSAGSMPSSRKMAWKWTTPRPWNSATLA